MNGEGTTDAKSGITRRRLHRLLAVAIGEIASADSLGGHGKDGWRPTRFPDVIDLVGEAIRHRDPSIGRIAVEAALANLERLPIDFWDMPFSPWARARAKLDPNDLRVLEWHGTGLIAVPMAIDENGHRAGTPERIRAAKATGRLEVRTHCHVTELILDEQDPPRVVGVRYLPGERLYRADRAASRSGQPTGPAREVPAKREVILSRSALGRSTRQSWGGRASRRGRPSGCC